MSSIKAITLAVPICMSLCAGACNDAESEKVTIKDLKFHECKDGVQSGMLATGREISDYGALECVSWKVTAQGTFIDWINHVEGCGFQGNEPSESLWRSELAQGSSDALSFRVWWDFEANNACGECLSDFAVDAEPSSLAKSFVLTVASRSCNAADCAWAERALNASDSNGIRCRYVDWAKQSFRQEPYRGKLGAPPNEGGCDDSLVAADVQGATLCLTSCAADSDCDASLMHCVDGACQLTHPW